MSRARNATQPDADGMYRTWCDHCDAEATFPTAAMAIEARKQHLCDDETPSCAWAGWEIERILAHQPDEAIVLAPFQGGGGGSGPGAADDLGLLVGRRRRDALDRPTADDYSV